MIAAVVTMTGCKYDDTELRGRVDDLDGRLSALELAVSRMNTDISSIEGLVAALQSGGVITDVRETETGYEITVSGRPTPIIIKHGADGEDGNDGADGQKGKDAPVVGVKQDSDGVYYWTITVDGVTSWLPDDEHKLPVSGQNGQNGEQGQQGVTPVIGVDSEGYWTVDYGDGPQRIPGDILASGGGDSYFTVVDDSDENFVRFVLKSGTELVVPRNSAYIRFAQTEDGLPPYAYYGGKIEITFTSKNVEYAEVLGVPEGWSVSMDHDNNIVTVYPPTEWTPGVQTSGKLSLLGLTENGQTIMAVQDIYVVDFADPDGTFIVLEGNMGSEDGALVYFDRCMRSHEKVFRNANGGKGPGNVFQDMYLDGDRMVLVCQNGSKNEVGGQIVVCDAHTLKVRKTYNGLDFVNGGGCPQHIAIVGDKMFIQYVDSSMESNSGIKVFDLAAGTLAEDPIDGTYGKFAVEGALKGRMQVSRGEVVAGLAKAVVFIDPQTETISKKVEFDGQVKGIVKGADGNFHVAVSGPFETLPGWGDSSPEGAKIVGIDHDGNTLYTYELPEGVVFPVFSYQPNIYMCASFREPELYLLTGDDFSIYTADRFNYQTRTLEPDFVEAEDTIYGYMGVHPVTGQLFVGQSVWYTYTTLSIFDTDDMSESVEDYNYTFAASPAGVDFAYRFSSEFINM